MRHLLLLLVTITLVACGGSKGKGKEKEEANSNIVYICNGSYATKYHNNENCRGLRNCSGSIEEITIEEAEDMGRTPCKICCE